MTYKTMKKLILNANAQFNNGYRSQEEYDEYRESQQNKIDVFYAKGRLTDAQYEELTGLWIGKEEPTPEEVEENTEDVSEDGEVEDNTEE